MSRVNKQAAKTTLQSRSKHYTNTMNTYENVNFTKQLSQTQNCKNLFLAWSEFDEGSFFLVFIGNSVNQVIPNGSEPLDYFSLFKDPSLLLESDFNSKLYFIKPNGGILRKKAQAVLHIKYEMKKVEREN